MTVAYNSTIKTNRMQVVADAIASKTFAAGTGTALTGTLVIGDSTLSGSTGVLATFTITTGVVSGVSGSVLTIPLSASTVTASGTGTAAKAEIRNNAGTVITTPDLTVGLSGTDVVLNSTAITSGQNVTCSSATLTHS